MVSAALRTVMLAAEGAGELQGAGVLHGAAEHPVCGDQVELSVRIAGGCIAELAWRARGCPASMAVPAVAVAVLRGAPVGEVALRLRAELARLGDLAAAERHAERLFLRAFAAATGC